MFRNGIIPSDHFRSRRGANSEQDNALLVEVYDSLCDYYIVIYAYTDRKSAYISRI